MGNFSAELSDTKEKFRTLLDREFGKLENVISNCLQEAQDNGSLNKKDNADQIASFVLDSWHGAMIRMKSTGNSRPLEDCKMMIMNKILV